jgi:hypothetical protein
MVFIIYLNAQIFRQMIKNNEEQSTALILPPFRYEPDFTGDGVKDSIQYTTNDFTSRGVICGCKPNKTYYSRANFKSSHLQTKVHKNWLLKLKNDKPHFLKRETENLATIKELQIREGKMRQENTRLYKKINDNQKQIIKLEEELEEEKRKVLDYEALADNQRQLINVLKKEKEKLEESWQKMGLFFGYEIIENDEE